MGLKHVLACLLFPARQNAVFEERTEGASAQKFGHKAAGMAFWHVCLHALLSKGDKSYCLTVSGMNIDHVLVPGEGCLSGLLWVSYSSRQP